MNLLKSFLLLGVISLITVSCVENAPNSKAAPAKEKGVEINLNTNGKNLKVKTDNTEIKVNNDDLKIKEDK